MEELKKEGFKIICNKCGKEIQLVKGDIICRDIDISPDCEGYLTITCENCGNTISDLDEG